MDVMHKCEGYWVPRDASDSVLYRWGLDDSTRGHGLPGVMFDSPLAPGGLIMLTFGGGAPHSSGGPCPDLFLSVGAAVALIDLLRAGIHDALVAAGEPLAPIPFRDVTAEPCCASCAASESRVHPPVRS
jgi:hypothetical protein